MELMMRAKITLLMLLFLLASCSRGFDRGLMRMQVSSTEKMEISEGAQTLKEILALKPQLPENARRSKLVIVTLALNSTKK